jgi:hypothetical protein
MSENRAPALDDELTISGPAPPPDVAAHGALPTVVTDRADGSPRYILYSDAVEGDAIRDYWLSVDPETVRERERWR